MVKQLSPVIRADGYHILADATGVPDLYAHIGPTLRRLLPGRPREPSALTGRARARRHAVGADRRPGPASAWSLGAILLLPRLIATAWDERQRTSSPAIPHEAEQLQIARSCLVSCGCSRCACPCSAAS